MSTGLNPSGLGRAETFGPLKSESHTTEALVNVADYVVTPSDDSTDIINNQSEAGDHIHFGPGTFNVSEQWLPKDNQTFTGMGDATVVKPDPNLTVTHGPNVLAWAEEKVGIKWDNIRFEGSKDGGTLVTEHFLFGRSDQHTVITNCTFVDATKEVASTNNEGTQEAKDFRFLNNTVRRWGQDTSVSGAQGAIQADCRGAIVKNNWMDHENLGGKAAAAIFYGTENIMEGNVVLNAYQLARMKHGATTFTGLRTKIVDNIAVNIHNDGVYFDAGYNVIEGNTIVGDGSTSNVFGVNVDGGTARIIDNDISEFVSQLINLGGGDEIVRGNHLFGATTTGKAFSVTGGSAIIEENVVEDIGGRGIELTSNNNWVQGNTVRNCTGNGIHEGGSANSNHIHENDLHGNNNEVWRIGADTTVERNTGYVTENSGSESVADGGTIAHGLDETPTYVDLTTSAQGHIAAASAVDGTNITVQLVDDAGSAVGTAETVYWEAKWR